MKWKKIIERAKKRRKFTEKEVGLASSFMTCAVKEYCKLDDNEKLSSGLQGEYGTKKGDRLEKLGIAFYYAVEKDSFSKAEKIYDRIHTIKK